MPPMPLVKELSVHWCLTASWIEEVGTIFHHSDIGVFTDMLIKHSKRHNMQVEIQVLTAASLNNML